MIPSELIPKLRALMGQDTRMVTIIVTQMDPDAMGSALALRTLLVDGYGRDTAIYYCGGIGHAQNQTIMNLLDLDRLFRPISEMPQQEAGALDGQMFAFVDSSSVYDSRLGKLKNRLKPRIVIDHHRGEDFNQVEGDVVWIERQIGAASTLLAELWREFFQSDTRQAVFNPVSHLQMTKLLCLGIYSDTHELLEATPRDRVAWEWLMGFIGADELKPFMTYPLREQYFEHQARAWGNRVRRGSILVTNCGYMETRDGDDLSTNADWLLRLTGVTQVYVWGFVEGKVRVSVRTEDVTLPLDQHLRAIFGEASGAKVSKEGHGEGGALIFLDFPAWILPGTEDEVFALVKRTIEAKILNGLPEEA